MLKPWLAALALMLSLAAYHPAVAVTAAPRKSQCLAPLNTVTLLKPIDQQRTFNKQVFCFFVH